MSTIIQKTDQRKKDYLSSRQAKQLDKENIICLQEENSMYGCKYFQVCSISKCPLDSKNQGIQLRGHKVGIKFREAFCPLYFSKTGKEKAKSLGYVVGEKLAVIVFGKDNPTKEDIIKSGKIFRQRDNV